MEEKDFFNQKDSFKDPEEIIKEFFSLKDNPKDDTKEDFINDSQLQRETERELSQEEIEKEVPEEKASEIEALEKISSKPESSCDSEEKPASDSSSQFLEEKPFFKEAVFLIETNKIFPNPYQPRKVVKNDSLFELAQSIRKFGILQPLVVQKKEEIKENGVEVYYQLLAGHRRLEAAKMIGLERVPAIIKEVGQEKENLEIAVIENLQREDLSPIEVARAFSRLIEEFKMTQREIAIRIGKSRQAIANALRLLQLPQKAQKALEERKISETHARILLGIENPEIQEQLLEEILAKNLTTRQAQLLAQRLLRKKEVSSKPALESSQSFSEASSLKEPTPSSFKDSFLKEVEKHLSEQLGWNISIVPKERGCQVILDFVSQEDLDNFLKKLLLEK